MSSAHTCSYNHKAFNNHMIYGGLTSTSAFKFLKEGWARYFLFYCIQSAHCLHVFHREQRLLTWSEIVFVVNSVLLLFYYAVTMPICCRSLCPHNLCIPWF